MCTYLSIFIGNTSERDDIKAEIDGYYEVGDVGWREGNEHCAFKLSKITTGFIRDVGLVLRSTGNRRWQYNIPQFAASCCVL